MGQELSVQNLFNERVLGRLQRVLVRVIVIVYSLLLRRLNLFSE